MTSFINVHLEADANFAPVYQELAKLKAALSALSKGTAGTIVPSGLTQGLKTAEEKMLGLATATKAFNIQTVALASSTERLTKQISQSKLKLGEYFSIISNSKKGIVSQLNDIAAAQARMQTATVIPSSTQKGYAHIITSTNMAANAAKQAAIYQQLLNTAYKDGAEKLINFGKNTQWAGRQLTAGLTVPMALAGKAASQMFLEVSAEMTRLQKVYGVGVTQATKAQLDAVRKEVMGLAAEMSKTLGMSAKETTSIAADLAAAGLTGKDLMNATKQASRMVILGETDKQDAIKATISLQTAFKLNTNELTDSVNFFNAAQAATSTNMADLIGAIPRVGPVVKGLGGDYKDMVALLVAMKEGGVSAGEGANALKNSLARIIAPTEKAKEVLKGYGIDMDTIVSKNAGNLIGTITELQAGLDRLPNLQRQRAISEMFGKYQFSRMTAMFNNFNREGTQSAKVMEMMGMSSAQLAGIAEKQTEQIQQSASGKYKIAMESFKTALLPIGESFLALATKVLNAGEKIVSVFTKLGPLATVIKAALAGMMIVGPITMVIGLIANLGGQLMKYMNFARMFKQGFSGTEGGMVDRFKGGMAGTKNFFKEADPALLANERLSKTVTEQVVREEDAIRMLTAAISEYAAEVQRLEQIYSGGPITPTPGAGGAPGMPGGTPGAGGSSVGVPARNPNWGKMPNKGRGQDRPGTSFGELSHTVPESSFTEENYVRTPTGEIVGMPIIQQGRAQESYEMGLNQALGSRPMPIMTRKEMAASSDEDLRRVLSDIGYDASTFDRSQLEHTLGEERDIAAAKSNLTIIELQKQLRARGAKVSKGASLDELVAKAKELDETILTNAEKLIDGIIDDARAEGEKAAAGVEGTTEKAQARGAAMGKQLNLGIRDVISDTSAFGGNLEGAQKFQSEYTRYAAGDLQEQIDIERTKEKSSTKKLKDLQSAKETVKDQDEIAKIDEQIAETEKEVKAAKKKRLALQKEYKEQISAFSVDEQARRDAQGTLADVKRNKGTGLRNVGPVAAAYGQFSNYAIEYAERTAGGATLPGIPTPTIPLASEVAEQKRLAAEAAFAAGGQAELKERLLARKAEKEAAIRASMTKGQRIRSRMSSGIGRAATAMKGQSLMGGMGIVGAVSAAGFGLQSMMTRGAEGKELGAQSAMQQAGSGLGTGMAIGSAVGQFLPPPYNLIATGAGAIIGSVGGLLAGQIAHAKMLARQEAAALAGAVETSTTALEHFKIKVTDFGAAAFQSAITTDEAVKTEINALAEKYKAQQEQDKKFADEVAGIQRMGSAEQFKLLKEKFIADMAAGLTATQAKTDIAAYMQNAGITGFGSAGTLQEIANQASGKTTGELMAEGIKNAYSLQYRYVPASPTTTTQYTGRAAVSRGEFRQERIDESGKFAFNFVKTAQSAQSLSDNLDDMNESMKGAKNQVLLTSDTLKGYNEKIREQNPELAEYNELAIKQAIAMTGMKDGSMQYQGALERMMIANKLFADGTITTANQMIDAIKSQSVLKSFLDLDTIKKMSGSMTGVINQAQVTTQADKASGKAEQERKVKAQKAVIQGLKDEYDQNEKLHRQAMAKAESAKEVQNAQTKLDDAIASGNIMAITAAQQEVTQTKNRIAQTAAYERRQAQLQTRIDKAQGQLDKLQNKTQTTSQAVSDAVGGAIASVSNAAIDSSGMIDTLVAGLASYGGTVKDFFATLSGKDANSPAGQAYKALKDAGFDMGAIGTGLTKIASTPQFKGFVEDCKKLGISLADIKSLTQVTSIKSASEGLKAISAGTVAGGQKGAEAQLALAAQQLKSAGQDTTAKAMGTALQGAFGTGKANIARAAKAFGLTGTFGSYEAIATKLGYGKENLKDFYWQEDGNKKIADPQIAAWAQAGLLKTEQWKSGPYKDKWYVVQNSKYKLPMFKQEYYDNKLLDGFVATSKNVVGVAADQSWVIEDKGGYFRYQKYNKDGKIGDKWSDVYKASGGYITGPGGPRDDAIRAWLSNGEYVVSADAVKRVGIGYLDSINEMRGTTPTFGSIASRPNYYADGGLVGNTSSSESVYNISVNVEGSSSSADDIARAVMNAMKRQQESLSTNRRIG